MGAVCLKASMTAFHNQYQTLLAMKAGNSSTSLESGELPTAALMPRAPHLTGCKFATLSLVAQLLAVLLAGDKLFANLCREIRQMEDCAS